MKHFVNPVGLHDLSHWRRKGCIFTAVWSSSGAHTSVYLPSMEFMFLGVPTSNQDAFERFILARVRGKITGRLLSWTDENVLDWLYRLGPTHDQNVARLLVFWPPKVTTCK